MKRIYRINALIGVVDPSLDRDPITDRHGRTIKHAVKGVRFVKPNEAVELDEKDGAFYLQRHGGTVADKLAPKRADKTPEKVEEPAKTDKK